MPTEPNHERHRTTTVKFQALRVTPLTADGSPHEDREAAGRTTGTLHLTKQNDPEQHTEWSWSQANYDAELRFDDARTVIEEIAPALDLTKPRVQIETWVNTTAVWSTWSYWLFSLSLPPLADLHTRLATIPDVLAGRVDPNPTWGRGRHLVLLDDGEPSLVTPPPSDNTTIRLCTNAAPPDFSNAGVRSKPTP